MTTIDVAWLTEPEFQGWLAFQRLSGQVNGRLARQLAADSGLSFADYEVLVALTASDTGALRAFELAELLGWEKSRLSHHVARMERRSFVRRRVSNDDGRGCVVTVSAAGRRALDRAAPGHVAAVRDTFVDRLEPSHLSALVEIADRVLGEHWRSVPGLDERPDPAVG